MISDGKNGQFGGSELNEMELGRKMYCFGFCEKEVLLARLNLQMVRTEQLGPFVDPVSEILPLPLLSRRHSLGPDS